MHSFIKSLYQSNESTLFRMVLWFVLHLSNEKICVNHSWHKIRVHVHAQENTKSKETALVMMYCALKPLFEVIDDMGAGKHNLVCQVCCVLAFKSYIAYETEFHFRYNWRWLVVGFVVWIIHTLCRILVSCIS